MEFLTLEQFTKRGLEMFEAASEVYKGDKIFYVVHSFYADSDRIWKAVVKNMPNVDGMSWATYIPDIDEMSLATDIAKILKEK